MRPLSLLLCALLLCPLASASEGKPAPGRGAARARAPDLGLGNLGAIPKGDGLEASSGPQGLESALRAPEAQARYELVGVAHARGVTAAAGTSRPRGAWLERVALQGQPARLEAFTTVVKVRCAARRQAPIEVVVLDPQGDTLMSASGALSFAATPGDVTEYVVDWEPTACRAPGAFQVLVRVAGQPLGTAPLSVVAAAP
jgi:hypothetical protein